MSNKEKIVEEVVEEVIENQDIPIYPGGPTERVIEGWKEKHSNVYLMEFEPEEVYIFRPITRREFKELAKLDTKDTLNREERVCEICVLWPENYDFIAMNNDKAGIPTLLTEEIMVKSGFNASNVVEM